MVGCLPASDLKSHARLWGPNSQSTQIERPTHAARYRLKRAIRDVKRTLGYNLLRETQYFESTGYRDSASSRFAHGVKRGEIKIPKFQRRFVWADEQTLNLLDRIASNYPVGSLLLWRTHTKLAAERNLGEFLLPKTDDMTPTDYVLDGQQRLTVIYSCLGAQETEPGFQAVYDSQQSASFRGAITHISSSR